MSSHILITPRSFGSTSDVPLRVLRDAGCTVHWLERPDAGPIIESMMAAALQGMDGVIVGTEPLTAPVIERATSLRAIAKYGVGMDNIAVEVARARGIAVGWSPDSNGNAVAELTLGLIFALARRIVPAANMVRAGTFEKEIGIELRGRTLGVIGLGRIGHRVARGAAGLGMRVIAYDPLITSYQEADVELTGLRDVCAHADIISLHVPLTPETERLIGADELALMKPGVLLINTARGGIVDERALHDALQHRRLGGAALDCFEMEPPGDNPLLRLENVIGTPHMGAHTEEGIAAMGRMAAENVVAALRQEPLPYPYP